MMRQQRLDGCVFERDGHGLRVKREEGTGFTPRVQAVSIMYCSIVDSECAVATAVATATAVAAAHLAHGVPTDVHATPTPRPRLRVWLSCAGTSAWSWRRSLRWSRARCARTSVRARVLY